MVQDEKTINNSLSSACVEYCYNKFGRSYSKKCDTMCDYARIVKEKDALIKRCKELEEQLRFICRYEMNDGK